MTTLEIINEVLRKLGVSVVSNVNDTALSRTLLDFLNDVIEEVSDYGDWQQMYREVLVTAQSSVGQYAVSASSLVKNIYEVAWDDDIAPLEVRSIQDIRRLQRLASYGTPRQFAVVGVSGNAPLIRVYPIPTTAAAFNIAFFKKPGRIESTAASNTVTPALPDRLLVSGLYAKALLEENGGEPTREYQVAYTEYQRLRTEAHNRFNADTGADAIYFTPMGDRYG